MPPSETDQNATIWNRPECHHLKPTRMPPSETDQKHFCSFWTDQLKPTSSLTCFPSHTMTDHLIPDRPDQLQDDQKPAHLQFDSDFDQNFAKRRIRRNQLIRFIQTQSQTCYATNNIINLTISIKTHKFPKT